MNQLSRRRFLQIVGTTSFVGGIGSPVNAIGFDLGGLVKDASPVLKETQALTQALTMNEEDEVQMGDSYYEKYIQQSGGRYSDKNAQNALKQFAEPLIATSERKKLNWDIVLLNNEEVNAWALPGGKMAVNSGLLSHVNNPDELGSVIAHEIGHVEKSHGAKQMRTTTFMDTISSVGKKALFVFAGTPGALTGEVLSALEKPIYKMVVTGYSRKREFEADAHIISVFDKVGFDPTKADDFFSTLNKLYPANTSFTSSLFSTHPGTKERIAKLEALSSKYTPKPASFSHPGWKALKETFPAK